MWHTAIALAIRLAEQARRRLLLRRLRTGYNREAIKIYNGTGNIHLAIPGSFFKPGRGH